MNKGDGDEPEIIELEDVKPKTTNGMGARAHPTSKEQEPLIGGAYVDTDRNNSAANVRRSTWEPDSDDDSELDEKDLAWYQKKRFQRGLFIGIGVLLVILLIVLIVTLGKKGGGDTRAFRFTCDQVKVNWTCGTVTGCRKKGFYSFTAIPYAQPPVGQRLWQPPVQLRDNETCQTYEAVNAADTQMTECAQRRLREILPYDGGRGDSEKYAGNLDCLYLSVYSPDINATSSLPVLVFFHGGWFIWGSGSNAGWAPDGRLARDLGVVVVTFNYRLSVYGWLALEQLQDGDKPSGNYGLMDQLAVLRWVNDNIANFGGDPDKVTALGHGAGGSSILALMTSPEVSGLLSRAWVMSPSSVYRTDRAEVYRSHDDTFRNTTRCEWSANQTVADCLRTMDPNKALEWVPYDTYPYWAPQHQFDVPQKGHVVGSLIYADGELIKKTPNEAVQGGSFLKIPLVISSMGEETDLIMEPRNLTEMTWGNYTDYAMARLTELGLDETDLKDYFKDSNSIRYDHARLVTDLRVTCALDDLALMAKAFRLVTTAAPSQLYEFEFGTFQANYSYHGFDLHALLESFSYDPSLEDKNVAATLRQMLRGFIFNGTFSEPFLKSPSSSVELGNNGTVTPRTDTLKVCGAWKQGGGDYVWRN